MKLLNFYFCLLLSLILTGCTVDTPRPSDVKYISKQDPIWQQNLKQIKQIQSYRNQGQLGYINSKERFSTQFHWQYHNPQRYQLTLSSALSSTTLTLLMTPQGMQIADNKGNKRFTTDAKALLREMTGVDFPLEHFAFWLKGQPDEQQDYQVGENHLLASFTYPVDNRVWTVDYLSYHAQQPALPKEILLKTEGQTLKIRVDEWQY